MKYFEIFGLRILFLSILTFLNSFVYSQSKKEQILKLSQSNDSILKVVTILVDQKNNLRDKVINEEKINESLLFSLQKKNEELKELSLLNERIRSSFDSIQSIKPDCLFKQITDSSALSNKTNIIKIKSFIDNETLRLVTKYKCNDVITSQECKDYNIMYYVNYIGEKIAKVEFHVKGYISKENEFINPIHFRLYFDFYGNSILFENYKLQTFNGVSNESGVSCGFKNNKLINQELYINFFEYDTNEKIQKTYTPKEEQTIEQVLEVNQSLYGEEDYNIIFKNQLNKYPNLKSFLLQHNISE